MGGIAVVGLVVCFAAYGWLCDRSPSGLKSVLHAVIFGLAGVGGGTAVRRVGRRAVKKATMAPWIHARIIDLAQSMPNRVGSDAGQFARAPLTGLCTMGELHGDYEEEISPGELQMTRKLMVCFQCRRLLQGDLGVCTPPMCMYGAFVTDMREMGEAASNLGGWVLGGWALGGKSKPGGLH